MTATLVTLPEAKDQLRILHSDEDAALQRTLDDAEAIVLDYLKPATNPVYPDGGWTAETVPLPVRAAILRVVGWLWMHRGDEDTTGTGALMDGFPSAEVRGLLMRWRDPALA